MTGTPVLTAEEQQRYARHTRLPLVGEEGQHKLKAARVLIIGLGGLGSPAALYLAAAGVGTLGLVDDDKVDLSNLQRQILSSTNDVGRSKAEAARDRLHAANPNVNFVLHPEKFTATNAEKLLTGYDIVIDGTDNFAAHYLINDACVLFGKSLVHASLSQFDGMVGTVLPKKSACYRCLYPSPPPPEMAPNCADAGVIGVLPGLAGTLQATEVVKLILGIGRTLAGGVLLINGLDATFRDITVPRDPSCPACGEKPMTSLAPNTVPEISAEQLKKEMASANPPFLLDVRNQDEFDEHRIENSVLIPLPVLAQRYTELDPTREMVVHCHLGGRSARAIQFLQTKGFTKLRNLVGGIEAY